VDAYKGKDDWEIVSKSLQELAVNLAVSQIHGEEPLQEITLCAGDGKLRSTAAS
jgi:hypothetical protein